MAFETRKIGEAKWQIDKQGAMRVPSVIYANDKLIEKIKTDRTMGQLMNVATMPGIINASYVMPDAHEGYGFPIGGVAAFDMETGVVSPGGVGYDINCGVRLIRTDMTADEIKPRMNELIDALFKNVPSGVGSKGKLRLERSELQKALVEGAEWAVSKGYGWKEDLQHSEEYGRMDGARPEFVSDMAMKRGAPQFGTLGAGNHFIEVQRVERVLEEKTAKAFGLFEGQAVVMLHCGSRGFGHQVCDDYLREMMPAVKKYNINLPDRELVCVPLNTNEAERYLGAMRCAVNYALCNRQVMTQWVRETFEQVFGKSADAMGMKLVYDVCHNIAKFEEHEVDGHRKKVCVHRKGATRAFGPGRQEIPPAYREVGQPVLIPGSMGTASYVLVGTKEAELQSFGSTCHGSGRVMSRTAAIHSFPSADVRKSMADKGIVLRGGEGTLVSEEAPGAYKNVDDVVGSVQAAGLSRAVARLVPMGVAKG
ncbi:MAG: RtcB family protein [Candidatus Burarchaeum sp.]|nr:RtcB family protein [Candidatus Burarchaeum sp.]MDO8340012.1 RtcB family protein [Candidatus Burarchaeum sp.]